MKHKFLPIAGAILNLFFFGLPDILVGRILLGAYKLLVEFFLAPMCLAITVGILDEGDTPGYHIELFLWSILAIYFVFVAADGYQTFRSAINKTEGEIGS